MVHSVQADPGMSGWNLTKAASVIDHGDLQALCGPPKAEGDLFRLAVPHGIVGRLLSDAKQMQGRHVVADMDRRFALKTATNPESGLTLRRKVSQRSHETFRYGFDR